MAEHLAVRIHGSADVTAAVRAHEYPVRLRLLSLIAARDSREVCACDLVDVLDRSQPTISHHLKVLHEAGLLGRERRGTWIHYSLSDDVVADIERATDLVFSTRVAV